MHLTNRFTYRDFNGYRQLFPHRLQVLSIYVTLARGWSCARRYNVFMESDTVKKFEPIMEGKSYHYYSSLRNILL